MKIIDVSKHNGTIDWVKVKADGIEGAVIRAGYGRESSQKDPLFEQNYKGAVAAGLHVGSYWYSYADTPADAITEAKVFLSTIKGKTFDLPVYFDIEEDKHIKLGKSVCTAMTENFLGTLENAGYFAGVYSFDSFFYSNLTPAIQDKYSIWVARVENIKPTSCKKYDMHQYSFKGKVNGISTVVDMNDCFKDFPAIIKKAGLNGYTKSSSAVPELRSVTASIVNIPAAQANTIFTTCEQMGMNVKIS